MLTYMEIHVFLLEMLFVLREAWGVQQDEVSFEKKSAKHFKMQTPGSTLVLSKA